MRRQVRRKMGASGIAATAISALDVALWDLKARLLDLPLARLLGCDGPPFPSMAAALHQLRPICVINLVPGLRRLPMGQNQGRH
jgi:hypothetical protein